MAMFTDDLVATVKRDAFLTTAQGNFTDQQILQVADDCLRITIIPLLLSNREGFFRVFTEIPFVANQSDYTIPTYAMYGKLESIQYLDQAGNILPYQMIRLEIENLGDVLPTINEGRPHWFSVNSSAITVYPIPNVVGDKLRVYFNRRPGTLIEKALAAQVLSVNYSTGVVTYTSAPPAGFTATSPQDFYNGQSPYQLKTQTIATAQAGSTQTFPVPSVQTLLPGDWVCPLDQTVFLPMPEELKPSLSDLVILSLARTQQDANLYQAQVQAATERMRQILESTGNRLPGNPKRIRITNQLIRANNVPRYR